MNYVNTPTVRQILDDSANKYGDRTFLRFKRDGEVQCRSFKDVRANSLAICRWIRNINPERMHIALIGKTNYEYITVLNGILISGNVGVPFAPDISVKEAVDLFKRTDIDCLFYDEDYSDRAEELKKLCPSLKITECLGNYKDFENIYETYNEYSQYANLSNILVDPDACAMIIYTSGTTGVRKGVMLSTLALNANNMYTDTNVSDDFNALSILPMHHVFCFVCDYLKNFTEGISIALNGNIRDLGENLLTFQPSLMRVVPLIAKSLLQKVRIIMKKNPGLTKKEAAARVFGENMKVMYSGGAYLNPEIAKEYDEFGYCLRQGYGMTEAGCKITIPKPYQDYDSVGIICPFVQARIVDDELQVKTSSIMMGYYNMPEETAAMFTEDGWLKTGDLGYLDEKNQLFLTGRKKNLICMSNGENVSPEAIEKKFDGNPLITEALVGEKDDKLFVEIFPNYSYAETNGITDIEGELNKALEKVNANAKASHILSKVVIREVPFEKTSTGKTLRRFSI